MCVCQALLDVPNSWRVAFRYFLALLILILLVELLEELLVADAGKIEDLESSGKIVIFLFLLCFVVVLRKQRQHNPIPGWVR